MQIKYTPLKINISPEKGPFQKERLVFQGIFLRFRWSKIFTPTSPPAPAKDEICRFCFEQVRAQIRQIPEVTEPMVDPWHRLIRYLTMGLVYLPSKLL